MKERLIFPDWPASVRIRALTTTRYLFETAPFEHGNLSVHSTEDPAKVVDNRAWLRELLYLPNEPLWLRQVHGVEVFDADQSPSTDTPIVADASITRRPGTVLTVLTADCLPILLCNRDGTEVAALHAGWRGLAAGVIERTLAHMNSPPACLLAWLGPAIGATVFEVGDEVRQAFLAAGVAAKSAFRNFDCTSSGEPKWLCDLYQLARQRLSAQGIQQIFGGEYCTFSDPLRFYSYRRDRSSDRMASLIWITPTLINT